MTPGLPRPSPTTEEPRTHKTNRRSSSPALQTAVLRQPRTGRRPGSLLSFARPCRRRPVNPLTKQKTLRDIPDSSSHLRSFIRVSSQGAPPPPPRARAAPGCSSFSLTSMLLPLPALSVLHPAPATEIFLKCIPACEAATILGNEAKPIFLDSRLCLDFPECIFCLFLVTRCSCRAERSIRSPNTSRSALCLATC